MKQYRKKHPNKHSRNQHPSDREQQPRKKKALGQHFLRKQSVVDHMIEAVTVTDQHSVLEIGCGDGFLTRSILAQTPCKQLRVYEIDQEWMEYVQSQIKDPKLNLILSNILDVDFDLEMGPDKPWVVLANLPYQITFPIMFRFVTYRHLFDEGVVMIQEEVAQKIVASRGKPYSATSLYLQYHFNFKLLEKIEPGAFSPPPKVFSRLLYFKPRTDQPEIPNVEQFWKFLKSCFSHPRQMLRNNLRSTHYAWQNLPEETLQLRAQQMSFQDFLELWKKISN
ncbi:MAG: ribosomal RNA small subunit methyltransferase A [Epsilonproteobacteria bacterium]|nr:ribosomal RNA small subunit methyltransferase A [Campylobacterota bacterium]